MNAYLLISSADDATADVVRELTRFSVRTAGCFGLYGAVSFETFDELREVTERIAAAGSGDVQVLMSLETDMAFASGGGIPDACYDPETGQIDWDCLGSPRPSFVKAAFFAVAVVRAESGARKRVQEQVAVTGGVTGVARLADPNALLVELGAREPDLLLEAVDALGRLAGVRQVRSGIAVTALKPDRVESA